ncbi:retrovirus-related pol polyprotein from transposon TNT 1-94 [Tanacetum coccineum]
MANLSEDIQCAGSDTRPPMLDKTDFASWQQRIRLYCRGKENGVNILKSIDEGPFQMGTTRVIVAEGTEGSLNLGPERPRVYSDLSQDEKDRYNADIRATNIILQGLPKDIYSLINHYTDAKDIWDNVKMLLEGSELTKEDRESQLYDDFEHFRQNKGETIHDYYVSGRHNKRVKRKNATGSGAVFMVSTEHSGKLKPGQAKQVQNAITAIAGGQDKLFDEDEEMKQPVHDLALNEDNRITPTGITEGERGFEQTKTCYLTEVIPFFKTLQEHFEGIQKALTKEVKEMSDAFDELEAELDQSIVDRKHDEIERKNLLIEHDNIIADGLSKEVFYVASNSELNVSRFTEMQKAHNVVKARCLELEAELSNLHSFQNKPSSPVNDTPDFNSVFVIGQMKASLQGKDNDLQPRSILKKHRIPPAKSDSSKKVEDHPRIIRSSPKTTNRVDSSISSKRTDCFKNIGTGDRSRLMNFVKKFIGTVRFGNDHFGAIMGYGDYVVGESVISRVYYVEGLGHNLFSVGQFCDSDLEVALQKAIRVSRDTDVGLNKTVKFIRTDNGTEFVNKTLYDYYESVGIFHQKTAPMFLWAEAMATACYTQNRSLIHTRHDKTPYELVHNKKPDLTFFRVFGALCYLTNDSENLGKLQPRADIRIFIGYAPSRKAPSFGRLFYCDDDDEEEHLAHAGSTVVSSPAVDLVPSAEETEPFETDESAVTPPPPPTYRTTSRIFVRSQTPIPFHYEAEVARILALPTPSLSLLTPLSSPLPQIPPPPTSLTYAQALLGCRATMMRAASPPTHHPLTLPAPSTSCRADIIEVTYCLGRSYYLLLSHIDRRTMAAIEVVNLRVSYQANVYRRESEEFYTRHQDAQGDRAPLRDEVDTLRIYISSLCTTHEQERVEARQALDSSEAHNRALEARIAVLETQARERIDTLEDTVSSA